MRLREGSIVCTAWGGDGIIFVVPFFDREKQRERTLQAPRMQHLLVPNHDERS